MLLITSFIFGSDFSGKCVGVSDGDTITVMRSGRAVKIRLEGIDSPENGQAFSSKAKKFTSNLVYGKYVSVAVKEIDRYGRLVGRVYVNGIDLSYEIVKNGYAWHFKKYSKERKLAKAHQYAKSNGVGLWSEYNPISPQEYRTRLKRRKFAASSYNTNSTAKIYWLNTKSNTRHNSSCRWYKKTKYGRMCTSGEGKACGVCGG